LVPNYERYYITKDKEIGEFRKDIDGKCLICDVRKFAFSNGSAIFVPQASFWRCWNLPPELFLTKIEKALHDRGRVYPDRDKI